MMKLRNNSNKIVGIGGTTILPEDVAEIPTAFEKNPIIDTYVNMGICTIIEQVTEETKEEVKEEVVEEAKDDEEEKKEKLKALKTMSDEEIGKLANELGINPADCKSQADVKRKITAILKK